FVLAEHDRWPAAAVAAGAAMLTRSVGIAVVAGLVVMAWPDVRKLAWLAIAPVMFAAFPIPLQLQVHDPWAFVHAPDEWARHVSSWGPFGGIWDAIRALWRTNHNFTEHFYLAVNIEALVFLAFFLALIPLVWRRVGVPYAVFTALVLAVPASVPSDRGDFPLFSMPRFTILAFPCFVALAVIGERPNANTATVAASSPMLGVAIVQWPLATLTSAT